MKCGYCQLLNSEEDHRCRKCGRRLTGTATAAPPHLARERVRVAVQALGANALAAAPVVLPEAQGKPVPEPKLPVQPQTSATRRNNAISLDAAPTLDSLPPRRTPAAQPSLFGAEFQPKIIPFDSLGRPTAADPIRLEPFDMPVAAKPASSRPVGARSGARSVPRRPAAGSDAQATLDFLPLRSTSRTLKTNAEAVIFCEAVAASATHRASAVAIDLAMILTAFGALLTIFQVFAAPAVLNRTAIAMLGAMFILTAMFYGLLFAISGAVTPGMRWTHLQLINFDGFPVDGRSRALRFASCWISVLSGGLGILWALLDEEHLTWHDHISKTFPTLRESDSIVVRQR